jgi:AbrB family looped-hinge helix DNA binding protein
MAVTLSPKFQIVIPKKIRESLNMKPGTKYELISWGDGIINIVPVPTAEEMFGSCPGMDTTIEREPDRL